jgi:hypothetical protein
MEPMAAISEPSGVEAGMPNNRLDFPTAVMLGVAISALGWGLVAWTVFKVFGRPV